MLSPEAEQHLRSLAQTRTVSKGTILIAEGAVAHTVYYVMDGCLRSYCTDNNGKEHTLQFAIKDWWISDFIAIYAAETATLTIECLTDSTVLEFNAKKMAEMLQLFPEYEPFQRTQLERHVVSLHRRILNQLQLTAVQRYELFLTQYPDIEQHCRNYHIASYLGVTQQSLSRIRAERAS